MLAGMSEAAPQHDEYRQEFFLDLARPRADTDEARAEARERWNAWRRDPANADVRVNFSGVDFRLPGNAGISFDRFAFSDWARFDRATFGDAASFESATFGNESRFDNATFGGGATFDRATFGHRARFDRATFGDHASFSSVLFGHRVRFDGAAFGNSASFFNATLDDAASFDRATFGVGANFDSATFGFRASFDSVRFGESASFYRANFGYVASFYRATFADRAFFNSTTFGDEAIFDRTTFGDGASFHSATFRNLANFRAAQLQGSATFEGSPAGPWIAQMRMGFAATEANEAEPGTRARAYFDQQEREGFGPHAFLGIDFSDARILGPISFGRRSFERPANFTDAQFHAPPDFDGASNLQRIDFTGARIGFVLPDHKRWKPHWTEDSAVPVRLRAFRKIAEDTKNHDLERDLYIEERKAERGVHRKRLRDAFWAERDDLKQVALLGPLIIAWCWRRAMDLYWLFSNYGRSLLRPPFWLLATLWPLVWAFDASLTAQRRSATQSAFASASEKPAEAAKAMKRQFYAATRQLAISNTIPFVGPLSIDGEVKKFLLCGAPPASEAAKACAPIAPWRYQLTLIGQNVLSALLLFFFGLALRNYFKVK